jgi:MobA/MobL family
LSWAQPHNLDMRDPVSRSDGRSIVAKAAYNRGENIRDERTGEMKSYSHRAHEIEFKGIFVDPERKKVPAWTNDAAKQWNCVEAGEKRKDSQLGQEIIAALPYQLSPEGRANIVKDFTREFVRGTGRIADTAIHLPPEDGDERNYHVHILFTMRGIGPDGWEAKKLAPITEQEIDKLDEKFALRAARELRREGFELEADRWAVGHLSKPEQLKDAMRRGDFEHAAWAEMEPTQHLGPAAIGMDRREPNSSDLVNAERERKAAEIERMKLAREMKETAKTIAALEKELAASERMTPQQMLNDIDNVIAQKQIENLRREVVTEAKAALSDIDKVIAEKQAERKPRAERQQPPRQTAAPAPGPASSKDRPLSRTDGEIRMAFSLTSSAGGFAKALEDRGLILAYITHKDIEKDRIENPLPPPKPKELWMSQTGGFARLSEAFQAKASAAYGRWKDDRDSKGQKTFGLDSYVTYVQDQWANGANARPISRLERATGNLAVVNSLGHVHTLNQQNTGMEWKQLRDYLKGIDRKPLLDVADARRVMGDLYQHRKEEKRQATEERREQAEAFGNSLVDRAADHASNDPRVMHGDRHAYAQAHKEALKTNRFTFARVTEIEADRSRREAAFAKELGGYQKEFKAGEIVIVREPGKDPDANRVHRVDQDKAEEYLRRERIDARQLGSVDDTKQQLNQQAAERNQQWREQRQGERKEQAERFGNSLIDRAVSDALNDPRQRNGEGVWTATAFREGLEKNRIGFARVSEEEAERSQREAAFAKELGGYQKEFQAGEIVIIREPGKTPEANRVHRVDQEKAKDYLRCVGMDASQLQNVEKTQKAVDARADVRTKKAAAAKARPALGPQSGGMKAHQAWANRKAKWTRPKEEDRPLRPDDYTERQRKERDSGEINPELYKTDPDYKRQVQHSKAYQSPEEKKQQRENDLRQLREERRR